MSDPRRPRSRCEDPHDLPLAAEIRSGFLTLGNAVTHSLTDH
ncbi:hypothetical protein AB0I68_29755 [Streptomyces sp. NPDC050448]